MASNVTQTYDYSTIGTELEFAGPNGLVKALPFLYGPNFHSSAFNPLLNNIRTGALMQKPHHCTGGGDTNGHAMTRKCLTDLHQSYCNEWITEGGCRVRCGQRFKVVSGGCGKHRTAMMRHSNNLMIKNLLEGKLKSISWDDLDDREKSAGAPRSEIDVEREAKQEIHARNEERLAKMEDVDALCLDSYSIHMTFENDKAQKKRAEREQRKIQAAQRKSKRYVNSQSENTSDEKPTAPMLGISRLDEKRRLGKSILTTGFKAGLTAGLEGIKPDAAKWAGNFGSTNV